VLGGTAGVGLERCRAEGLGRTCSSRFW